MAISAPHYRCLRELHRRGELPQGGSILEIGEANWYGDMLFSEVRRDFPKKRKDELESKFQSALNSGREPSEQLVLAAKLVYDVFFQSQSVVSIDFQGTLKAVKRDLNESIEDNWLAETVINHGTAEHIFNVAQVFRTMHDHCAVGGLMIHESPFTGWIDHGFWTIQPTTYFDLCAANGYKLVYMAVTQIDHNSATEIHSREQLLQMAANGGVPNNAMLYVAMRKETDAEFKIPMQGVYAGTAGAEARQAWHALR